MDCLLESPSTALRLRLRLRARTIIGPALSVLPLLLLGGPAMAAIIPGTIVLQEGDTPTGVGVVVTLNAPFVNAGNEVAFVGDYDNGDHYVLIGNTVVWEGSDDLVDALTAAEATMDSNGMGSFVYAPDINGLDGLYTELGVFGIAGDPAVGFPVGSIQTSFSFPSMTASGAIYWRAGVDIDGDGTTDLFALYRAPDGTPASTEVVLASGDLIGMFPIDDNASGIDGNYAISEDGVHHIHHLDDEGPSTADDFIWVDGLPVARELDPIPGEVDNWDNFDLVAINSNGNYLFTGDTDGSALSDEFLAYNGAIAIREGDTVGGILLNTSATLRYAAINDFDQAAFVWGYTPMGGGFRETVFFSCDASDLANNAQAVMTTFDDDLDLNDDGFAEYQIVDVTITGATPARIMGESLDIYVELALDDGMSQVEAIVELPVTCCGNAVVDGAEGCDDANLDDTDDCLSTCVAASCGDGFLWDGVEECDDANLDDTDACPSTCTTAFCSDGFVQAGVEDCDDGNFDDTDACVGNCVTASCGDGFIQAGVEDCDDQNADDTDNCLSTCIAASCGDGFLWDGVEICDDGNADDTDACLSICELASCGDGLIQVGFEDCDDQNADDTDNCLSTCIAASCGDGFVWDGVEECDDGNEDDDDDCRNDCTLGGDESTGDTGDTVGASSGETGETGETGVDDTAGTGMDDTGGTGTGDSGVADTGGPMTAGATSTGEGTEGDTDTDSGGGVGDPGGCSCRTDQRPRPGLLWGLAGLGLLGLGRRRRRP